MAYRKLQARGKLGSKPGQVQDAGLTHGALAIPNLDVASHHQTVSFQGLQAHLVLTQLYSMLKATNMLTSHNICQDDIAT